MQQQENSAPDTNLSEKAMTKSTLGLVQVSSMMYAVFALVGILLSIFVHKNFASNFAWPVKAIEGARLAVAGLLGAGVLIILSKQFEWMFPSYRAIKAAMVSILGRCTVVESLYLAAISSVGEELLFRGAIQPFVGLAICSLLFGLLHVGPSGEVSSWSLWAVAAGWLLGYMFEQTGSLWAPIFTHALVNAVSILNLRRLYRLGPANSLPGSISAISKKIT